MNDVPDTSYEPFTLEPEYRALNRDFLASLSAVPADAVLDLACGTGLMTALWLELREHAPPSRCIGLDLSRESLSHAYRRWDGLGVLHAASMARSRALLTEGNAERLPFANDHFDLVLMGNAIQLVPDLDAMLREIHRVLRPGGYFAFNTSFYAGTYCPGTEGLYLRWVQEAVVYLAECDRAERATGGAGVRRRKGEGARAFSRPWLSADDYGARLADAGLVQTTRHERTVLLGRSSLEKIGAYSVLARVLLSGYPAARACAALVHAAGPALQACGYSEVPRYWLELCARKAE